MKTTGLKLFIILELLAVLLVFVIGFIGFVFEIPFPDLTANPISRMAVPFYQGILQRIGTILWGGTVLLTLFSYSSVESSENLIEIRKFLLSSGIFFGYFLMDELLLIHNFIFPKVLNIHQLLILILYVAATLFFLLRFRKILCINYLWIFMIAISFLGLSMIIDILSYLKVVQFEIRYFLDDGAKFLGIFNLFIYYFFYCKDLILDYKYDYKIKN